ncbi:YppE family protein [Bacillus sp. FJAT-29790]|uniref:YppE family protein n=1 Tax=Bacillus sp. FJAT-29790 TaxID=1895002 RepID=UPI001C23FBA7|nr:YppE family protein [Bacillus sp. FJAT-29790]MBU8879058.1 YppE family protein [Bacillus sp. FJAT-29790]
MNGDKELLQLTKQLLAYNAALSERFEKVKESGTSGDFYREVKPFADEVKEINDKWKTKAVKWVHANTPRNLYAGQIESAHEHMESISVQAFFPQTGRTGFINLAASSKYVLNHVIMLLTKEERES